MAWKQYTINIWLLIMATILNAENPLGPVTQSRTIFTTAELII